MKKGTRLFFALAWAANLLLAVLTLASAYGGAIDPRKWVFPAMLAMTFPFWLFASLGALVVDLFFSRRRWMWVVPVVTLLLCVQPVLRYAPLNFSSEAGLAEAETQGRAFTVLSYNVFNLGNSAGEKNDSILRAEHPGEKLQNATASEIIRAGADIVLLQEMDWLTERPNRFFTQSQVDSLKRIYPHRCGDCGEVIYSKFPLRPIELRQDPSEYCEFTGAVVDIEGRETLVISAHFESIGLSPQDRELYHTLTEGEGGKKAIKAARTQLISKLARAFRNRTRQALLLRQQIDSLGIENVIVGGDFNDIPDCYALRSVAGADMRSAFADGGRWPIITYHSQRFYFHIDHILYRGPELRAVAFRRGSCPRSDHYPIEATFIWEKP